MNQSKDSVILTIDDEAFIRISFRNFLEDCDYRVLEADNGRAGVEIFQREHPDLVLLDLRMPEMDGLEVLQVITAQAPDTPVIVVSGTGVLSDALEALRLGAWDYLMKPVEDLSVMQHAVERALERSRLLKENRNYKKHLEEIVNRYKGRIRQLRKLRASRRRPG